MNSLEEERIPSPSQVDEDNTMEMQQLDPLRSQEKPADVDKGESGFLEEGGENSAQELIEAEDEEGAKMARSSAAADQMGDDLEKILNKIPPDWDAAEKYGLANLAYDPSKCTDLYNKESDKFCHCSQQQIPTDEDFYPLCDNFILGELGEGFPILFQLMWYINCLLFLLIFIFFFPTIGLISSAVSKFGDKTAVEEKLSLYSFGALLKYMDPENLVVFKERQDYIIGYCVCLFFGVLITFIFI